MDWWGENFCRNPSKSLWAYLHNCRSIYNWHRGFIGPMHVNGSVTTDIQVWMNCTRWWPHKSKLLSGTIVSFAVVLFICPWSMTVCWNIPHPPAGVPVLYSCWGLLWPLCGVLAALVHIELHDHCHFSDHSLVLFRSCCSLSLPISNENVHQYPADWHYHVQVSVFCLGMSSSIRVCSRTDTYLDAFWSVMWPWNSIHVDDLSAMPLRSFDLHWRDRWKTTGSRTDTYLHTFWSTVWPWNSIHVDDLSAMPLPSLDLHWRDRWKTTNNHHQDVVTSVQFCLSAVVVVHFNHCQHKGDDVGLNVLGCQVDILGTTTQRHWWFCFKCRFSVSVAKQWSVYMLWVYIQKVSPPVLWRGEKLSQWVSLLWRGEGKKHLLDLCYLIGCELSNSF